VVSGARLALVDQAAIRTLLAFSERLRASGGEGLEHLNFVVDVSRD
jgi:hypothetical protein